jgi:pleiotropic regulator 1
MSNNANLQVVCLKSLKKTSDLFLSNVNEPVPNDTDSHKSKIASKIYGSEYRHVKDLPPLVPQQKQNLPEAMELDGQPAFKKMKPNELEDLNSTGMSCLYSFCSIAHLLEAISTTLSDTVIDSVISDIAMSKKSSSSMVMSAGGQIIEFTGNKTNTNTNNTNSKAGAIILGENNQTRLALAQAYAIPLISYSDILMPLLTNRQQYKKPKWHAPWKLKTVIAGHLGWVRSIAVEPGNEWFATGAADKLIKIWDLASGTLKTSFTGHISTVRYFYVFIYSRSFFFFCLLICLLIHYLRVCSYYFFSLLGD